MFVCYLIFDLKSNISLANNYYQHFLRFNHSCPLVQDLLEKEFFAPDDLYSAIIITVNFNENVANTPVGTKLKNSQYDPANYITNEGAAKLSLKDQKTRKRMQSTIELVAEELGNYVLHMIATFGLSFFRLWDGTQTVVQTLWTKFCTVHFRLGHFHGIP